MAEDVLRNAARLTPAPNINNNTDMKDDKQRLTKDSESNNETHQKDMKNQITKFYSKSSTTTSTAAAEEIIKDNSSKQLPNYHHQPPLLVSPFTLGTNKTNPKSRFSPRPVINTADKSEKYQSQPNINRTTNINRTPSTPSISIKTIYITATTSTTGKVELSYTPDPSTMDNGKPTAQNAPNLDTTDILYTSSLTDSPTDITETSQSKVSLKMKPSFVKIQPNEYTMSTTERVRTETLTSPNTEHSTSQHPTPNNTTKTSSTINIEDYNTEVQQLQEFHELSQQEIEIITQEMTSNTTTEAWQQVNQKKSTRSIPQTKSLATKQNINQYEALQDDDEDSDTINKTKLIEPPNPTKYYSDTIPVNSIHAKPRNLKQPPSQQVFGRGKQTNERSLRPGRGGGGTHKQIQNTVTNSNYSCTNKSINQSTVTDMEIEH
jgi:hypothetical protein